MVSLRLFAAVGLLMTVAQAVTPVEKVIQLLDDLKKEVEAEGKAEAGTYDKFACFCKSNTKSKSKSITEGQDKIDTTTADIGDKEATKKGKISDLAKEKEKVEEATIDLQKATEAYEKDKTAYEATSADLAKALSSTRKALKALKDAKPAAALIDLGQSSDVNLALDMADALGLIPAPKQKAVTMFLQQKVDPNDPEYKFHSDKIIKIIEDLEKDFKKKKDDVEAEWQKTDKSYKAEKKDLEGKIETGKKQIKTLTGDIEKLITDIANLKDDLITAQDNLEDDSKYLKDLTVKCEHKAQVWDQRSSQRHDEVEALKQAQKILKDTVKDLDTKVNKRAMLLTHKPATKATKSVQKLATNSSESKQTVHSKSKAASFLEEASRGQGFLSKVSLLQVASTSRQERVIQLLKQEGTRLDSVMLSSVANKIGADPFVKIKKLIQGLIERLLAESRAEATKKGFCDTELGKAYETRESRFNEINKLDADLSELRAKKAELTEEIKDLKDDVKGLKKGLQNATDLRATEKSDNEKTIKKANEGAVAVAEALVILKDFYASGAKAKVFLQVDAEASPVQAPSTGFQGAYKGNQEGSKAVLGLLEVIKSDFERTSRTTEAAEAKALAEFVEFERTSKADIASKETKIALDQQDLDSTTSAYDDDLKDLKTATKILDTTLKSIEDLKPTCIDTGMSYKDRVKKREDEIEALKKALCMLDTENVESQCGR